MVVVDRHEQERILTTSPNNKYVNYVEIVWFYGERNDETMIE